MTLTYVSIPFAVENLIVKMRTQDGNETNNEVIQCSNTMYKVGWIEELNLG